MELKDPAKMTNEEIHKDVADATQAAYKIICDMVLQYEDKYRWKLAARVVNSLWAVVYKPTMSAVVKQLAEDVRP